MIPPKQAVLHRPLASSRKAISYRSRRDLSLVQVQRDKYAGAVDMAEGPSRFASLAFYDFDDDLLELHGAGGDLGMDLNRTPISINRNCVCLDKG